MQRLTKVKRGINRRNKTICQSHHDFMMGTITGVSLSIILGGITFIEPRIAPYIICINISIMLYDFIQQNMNS